MENLIGSGLLGVFFGFVALSLLLIVVSFVNIHAVERFFDYEPIGVSFRRPKKKRSVAPNTKAFRIIGWLLVVLAFSLSVVAITVDLSINLAFILLGILWVTVLVFVCVTAHLEHQTRK